jgi:hypothetical protein
MGMSFVHPDAPGAGPHYLRIATYAPNRNSGLIVGMVEVYADEATFERWRAADQAWDKLEAQCAAKDVEWAQAEAELRKLPYEVYVANQEEIEAARRGRSEVIQGLKAQQTEQNGIRHEARPKRVDPFEIGTGLVKLVKGRDPVPDIYAHLMDAKYPGATKAG